MNKAKEWIDELQSNPDWSTTYIDWEAVDEIEDALKALKILKNYEGMIDWPWLDEFATKEEKKILKEVFK